MVEPSRTETPRDELRRRIRDVLQNALPDEATLAVYTDAIVGMFQVRERHRDLDVTTYGDMREQVRRQRFIVAELAREAEPERIEGAWRG